MIKNQIDILGTLEQLSNLAKSLDTKLLSELKKHAKASNDPVAWVGVADILRALKKFDEAHTYYAKVLKLSNNTSFLAWTGIAFIHHDKEEWQKALEACDQAIAIHDQHIPAWGMRGRVLFEIFYSSESCMPSLLRAHFLAKNNHDHVNHWNNPLILLNFQPNAPFLQSRLLTHLPDHQIHEFTDLILTTHAQCHAVQTWLEWLTASARPSANWLGRLHFYMGDCIEAFRLLREGALAAQPDDLQAWYYAVLAAEGFCEKTEPLFEQAMPVAEGFLPPKKGFFGRLLGQKLPPVDAKQCYYAGLFFLLKGEKGKALACFSRCAESFLPAAHFEAFLIRETSSNDGKRQTALEKIVAAEKLAAENGFAKGIEPHFLTLDAADFEGPLDRFSFYQELVEPIRAIYEWNIESLSTANPDEQKPLWELWKLDATTKRRIVGQLFWKKWGANIAESRLPDVAEKQAELAASKEKLHQLFDALEAETNAEKRFLKLGLRIQEWDLSPQLLQQTVVIAQAKGFISPSERAVLHCYVICKSRGQWLQIDWANAGTEEALQKIIEKTWDGMGILAGWTAGSVLGAFVGGTVATIIKHFLQPNACRAEDFKTFKKEFDIFLGTERERLGEGTFKRLYRIFDLENC